MSKGFCITSAEGELDTYTRTDECSHEFVIAIKEHWVRTPRVSIGLSVEQAKDLAVSLLQFVDNSSYHRPLFVHIDAP